MEGSARPEPAQENIGGSGTGRQKLNFSFDSLVNEKDDFLGVLTCDGFWADFHQLSSERTQDDAGAEQHVVADAAAAGKGNANGDGGNWAVPFDGGGAGLEDGSCDAAGAELRWARPRWIADGQWQAVYSTLHCRLYSFCVHFQQTLKQCSVPVGLRPFMESFRGCIQRGRIGQAKVAVAIYLEGGANATGDADDEELFELLDTIARLILDPRFDCLLPALSRLAGRVFEAARATRLVCRLAAEKTPSCNTEQLTAIGNFISLDSPELSCVFYDALLGSAPMTARGFAEFVHNELQQQAALHAASDLSSLTRRLEIASSRLAASDARPPKPEQLLKAIRLFKGRLLPRGMIAGTLRTQQALNKIAAILVANDNASKRRRAK